MREEFLLLIFIVRLDEIHICINLLKLNKANGGYGRDEDRISRALAVRSIYDSLDKPTIDTTPKIINKTLIPKVRVK